MVENQTGRKMKVLRSRNGGEYTSKEFKDYLTSKGIKHQLNISVQLKQNKVLEHMNRTLTECAAVSDYRLTCQKDFGQRR